MLESVRKAVAIPQIPVSHLVSVGVVLTFFWLLIHDHIHPFLIYLVQIYLTS